MTRNLEEMFLMYDMDRFKSSTRHCSHNKIKPSISTWYLAHFTLTVLIDKHSYRYSTHVESIQEILNMVF